MTNDGADAVQPTFETLMAEVMTTAQRFGHHVDAHPGADFDAFVEQNSALLDKRLLSRFYRSATLAAAPAKDGWVEPDLAPFPWQRFASA